MAEEAGKVQQTKCLQTTSVAETRTVGQMIGTVAPAGAIIALCGHLGAGKTAMAQGIAQGLGITTTVTSPTFIFMNEYPTAAGTTLIHVDSYRLGDAPDVAMLEAFTVGLDEILSRDDVIVIIEWADLLQDLLPSDHLQITLSYDETAPTVRTILCTAHGPLSNTLLAALPA